MVEGWRHVAGDRLDVCWKSSDLCGKKNPLTNAYIGCFVTGLAQIKLLEALEKDADNVLYCVRL
jgi:hypothetical protein